MNCAARLPPRERVGVAADIHKQRVRRRLDRAVEPRHRALSGDDRAAGAFATGFRAGGHHGEGDAADTAHT